VSTVAEVPEVKETGKADQAEHVEYQSWAVKSLTCHAHEAAEAWLLSSLNWLSIYKRHA
jgi:hypothetical protein